MSKEFSIHNLPKGWVTTTLSEVSLNITDGSHNPPKRQEKGVPMLSAQNINNGTIDFDRGRLISEEDFIFENERTNIQSGDVLITTVATIGRVAIVPENLKQQFAVQRSVSVVKPLINGKYLMYYCQSPVFQELLSNNATGTAQKGIYLNTLRSLPIPVSPENEQSRIAFKLEELFSELEHSVDNLKLAQKQLKVYRQVLLKQAFEGKLTVQWRKENAPEPAKKLLDQIKKEQQALFEQNLKDWKAAVKEWEKKRKEEKRPRKPRVPTKVSSLTSDELALLPTIPKTWLWDKFGTVCLKIMDGTHFSPKNSENGDYMYITAKNIQEGRIDLEGITYVTEEDHRTIYSRCDVQKGDILYVKDGATTGRTAVNDIDEEFSLLSSVGVFRTPKNLLIPKFLEYYLNSEVTRKRMLSKTAGVAITRLTLVKLNNSVVCLCSTDEQEKIVEILESQFSIIDNLEKTISSSLQKSEFLRQSILKKAFKGELINQDFNDEPASLLLDRIKKEREAFLKVEKERKSLDKSLNKKRRRMAKNLKHIIDILKESKEPILANRLWEDSIYKDDIDAFYAELKTHIETGEIIELPRLGKKSYLKLADSK
ncbi:restriction endonuclease subunit S [Reichenbachiella sp.]|uniref:restriction endonuclease subunit S n=1 Tax=Reichenbachiella sp. TaxID=2184521 RepID=UPI0032997795